jgi:immune inhibitor A
MLSRFFFAPFPGAPGVELQAGTRRHALLCVDFVEFEYHQAVRSTRGVMQQPRSASSNWLPYAAVAALLICLCLALVLAGGGAAYLLVRQAPTFLAVPSHTAAAKTPVVVNRPPPGSVSSDTEVNLQTVVVPDSDLYDLACRLQDNCNVTHTLPAPSAPPNVGDKRMFWVMNSDTSENFQVSTTLRYITPHSYFWLEDGIEAKDADIAALMTAFEDKIYPTDRRFFGSEWTPGVDNDPHLYILYVRGVGATTGGYYSTADEYNPAMRKYSNGHELFVFNADGESLTDEYTYGTLAHEFQHMIHWNLDRNESGWLNEGFSEVAAFLNGYTVGGVDSSYAQNPDLPLTDWTSLSDNPDITANHYGQSFLFLMYFLDRFGDQATQALVKDQENSLTSVDDTLKSLNITDKESGLPITADDVALDWMVTLYLGDGKVGDGRYVYHNYPSAPRAEPTQKIAQCPRAPMDGSVSQYGPEYVEVTCVGDHTLSFKGSTVSQLLPADPHSGKYAFWSNKGDESDMTLTRAFDFSKVTGPIDFSYWTWYDLEKGYDYLYLEASADGTHWDILKTPSCTEKDLSGNAYGCGYTAMSGGGDAARWILESADLSPYAGKTVQLRFEYVTDAALNGEGFLLDDLSIPAVGYSADFEADAGGWTANGFARIENALPQTFRLALIVKGSAGTIVQYVTVNPDQTADIPLSLKSGESAVLVVTGTQRFTRLPAGYTIQIK